MAETPQSIENKVAPHVPLEDVLLSEISPSPTNPRQQFDEAKLANLAATIRSTILLSPIILRKWPASWAKPTKKTKYELVAGERRFRAFQINGEKAIPSRICELTDSQVVRIQLIENAQREDIHPLHQAQAFERLVTMNDGNLADCALTLGHREDFMAKRLSLLQLIPPLKSAFEANELRIGHALMLAPLPASLQTEAMGTMRRKEWDHHSSQNVERIISVTELAAFIKSNLMMVLSSAPWKLKDETLLPAAGSCQACSKRTGAAPSLFDDMELGKSDRCLDRDCFGLKRRAFFNREVEFAGSSKTPLIQITSNYQPTPNEKTAGAIGTQSYSLMKGDRKCDNSELAIVSNGPELGNRVRICRATKNRCSECTYYRGAQTETEKPLGIWERRAKELPKKIDWAVRKEVLKSILFAPAAVDQWNIPHSVLGGLVYSLAGQGSFEVLDALALDFCDRERLKFQDHVREEFRIWSTAAPKTPVAGELQRMLLGLSLADTVGEFCGDEPKKRLKQHAAAFGIDYDRLNTAITAEMTSTFKEKRKKAQGGKPATKKAAGRKRAAK